MASCLDAGKLQQAQLYLPNLNPAALMAAAPDRDWNARLAYQRGRMAQQSGRATEAQQQFTVAQRLAENGRDDDFASRVKKALADLSVPATVPKIRNG